MGKDRVSVYLRIDCCEEYLWSDGRLEKITCEKIHDTFLYMLLDKEYKVTFARMKKKDDI
jgi:hypothetical protein